MRILSSVFLLLEFVATSVHSEKCPDPADIHPCTCINSSEGFIKVSCNGTIKKLQQLIAALNSLSKKSNVELNFYGLDLGRVPSDIFNNIGVKKLSIKRCKLASLAHDDTKPALFGLENTLEELIIASSYSEPNIPAKLKLDHMRKLKKLHLAFNNITDLGNDWFDKGPVSLEALIISGNKIDKVGDRAFTNLSNLKWLSFSSNGCKNTLKRSMLPNPAYRLLTLKIDKNCLPDVPEDVFTHMPSLQTISLRSNKIKRLEQSHWQEIWQQVNVIHLEGNPVKCDSHMDWMFEIPTKSRIFGNCAAPPERKGLSLSDYIYKSG